jgi:hypothetical protein
MHQTLTHVLNRTSQIRRQLERERQHARALPARLLRLQALLLRAQRHLIEIGNPAVLRPVPIMNTPTRR